MKEVEGKQDGFTLVELMVVVAIIGILTAVAMPAYNDYIVGSRIPDATSSLANRRVQMEQFFQDNRTYLAAPACTANTTASAYFNFSCTVLTAATYTLEARGKASMDGFVYTLDQAGTKATTAVPSGWVANGNCWTIKKDGSC